MEGESIISLFGKVVKGDEAAFRLLFETYSRRLFHVAYYYLNSRELAEEAILDVFTVIWQKRETLSHVKDSLPPKCREVFRLVLSDKLKNREIADVLGISEKTVNIHIAKAYERIAEFVNRRYKEGSIK
mgnify:CR=1 FL=1